MVKGESYGLKEEKTVGILNSAFELQLLPPSPSSVVPGRKKEFPVPAGEGIPDPASFPWSRRARTEPRAGFVSPIKLGSDELGCPNTPEMPLPPPVLPWHWVGIVPLPTPRGDRDRAAPHPCLLHQNEGILGKKSTPAGKNSQRRCIPSLSLLPKPAEVKPGTTPDPGIAEPAENRGFWVQPRGKSRRHPGLHQPQLCCSSRTFSPSQTELPVLCSSGIISWHPRKALGSFQITEVTATAPGFGVRGRKRGPAPGLAVPPFSSWQHSSLGGFQRNSGCF